MLEDNSKMPIGKHRKKLMSEVPDDYLIVYYKENVHDFHGGLCSGDKHDIMTYIEDSFTEHDLV